MFINPHPFASAGHHRPAGGLTTRRDQQIYGASDETDFSSLRNRRTIVLVDDANIDIGYQEQTGHPLDFGRMLSRMRRHAASVNAHAIMSVLTLEQEVRADALGRAGYDVHRIPHTNVDVAVGFVAGVLAQRVPSRTSWIIASGDAELVLCVAGALNGATRHPDLVTLSVRHSTARALRQSPMIRHNIFLANDLMLTEEKRKYMRLPLAISMAKSRRCR